LGNGWGQPFGNEPVEYRCRALVGETLDHGAA
jgi:hypothetical protein